MNKRTTFPSTAILGLLASLMSSPMPALAQGVKAPSPDPELRGEWRRAGPGFACEVVTGNKQQPDPDQLIIACQRLGALSVGVPESALIASFGEPQRKLDQPDNAVGYVYFLGKPQQYPYVVGTVKAGRVIALQASGEAPVAAASFNQVNLGDSTDKLRARFGIAFHVGPSGLANTDLWSYGQWPFSFEVRNERVTSIRITDPTAKPTR
ncbi:hypothetical protein [Bradyrhizobium oropedii]|uniref:hypothetical protein n=1 Tax=Bradyrhizobium oropedii TaxID=1571201 RepID=UPI001E59FD6E|nr:hypothetical protein [Bradyrhizobium oropedii]